MQNLKKLIILLLIVNIAVVIYYGQSIKKELRTLDMTHSSNYQNVLNQVINQGNHLSSSIEYLIRENNNVISDFKYSIKDTDLKQKKGTVEIELLLKETSSNSKVVGQLNALDDSLSVSIDFEQVEGLTYRSVTSLQLDHNYEIRVYEQSMDGANKQLNSQELSMHLYNEVYANRVQGLSSGTSMNENSLTYHYNFTISSSLLNVTDIDKIILQAIDTSNQNKMNEYDISNSISTTSMHNAQLEDKYKIAIASGEIDHTTSFSEYVEEYGSGLEVKDQDHINYAVEKTFTKEELNESWDMYRDGKMYFSLKVIFKDGVEIEL